MKKLTYLLLVIAVTAVLSSCGTTKSSVPYNVGAKLEIQMSDLKYLGESTISCEYDTYLGVIRHIVKVNDEVYVPGNDEKMNIVGGIVNFGSKAMNLAAAKLLSDFPDATYFQVVMDSKQTEVAFLGSSTKRVAKVRAYKFKN
jgi:hypothetical protein